MSVTTRQTVVGPMSTPSARIGAAAALTLVLVVLLILDVVVPDYDISPGILLPLLGANPRAPGARGLRVLESREVTTTTALLTNKAYDYPTRGARRVGSRRSSLACTKPPTPERRRCRSATTVTVDVRRGRRARRGRPVGERGSLPRTPTARQVDVLAAFVAAGGSVPEAAGGVGIRPSTAKRHLADPRAGPGRTTEQLIDAGRAEGWLIVANLDPG